MTPELIIWLLSLIGFYFALVGIFYLILLLLSYAAIKQQKEKMAIREILINKNTKLPPISLAVPAHNEDQIISQTLNMLTKLNYPEYELIVIDDGSSDQTFPILQNNFKLLLIESTNNAQIFRSESTPNLRVIHKINTGKPDSLNFALQYAKHEIFCVVDSDTVLEVDALFHIGATFLDEPECYAVGSTVRLVNGAVMRGGLVSHGNFPSHNVLVRAQIMEYIRSFFVGRLGWERLNATLFISGAFSAFRKNALLAVQGFDPHSYTEDLEIVLRLTQYAYKNNKKAVFHILPTPLVWTQAPEDLYTLKNQRVRWQRGLIASLLKHWRLFNPRLGIIGLIEMPYLLLVEVLSPIFEIAGLSLTIYAFLKGYLAIDVIGAIASLGVFNFFFINAAALFLEEKNFARHSPGKGMIPFLLITIYEIAFYHLLNTLFRFWALVSIPFIKPTWGKMRRVVIE